MEHLVQHRVTSVPNIHLLCYWWTSCSYLHGNTTVLHHHIRITCCHSHRCVELREIFGRRCIFYKLHILKQFLDAFAKRQKETTSYVLTVCLSVHLSAWNSAPTGRIFIKIDNRIFFQNKKKSVPEKFKFH